MRQLQVGLVPISSDKHLAYAEDSKGIGWRLPDCSVELDARNEKMNAKIREFGMQKVPFILVMGDKEAGADEVSVRTRGKGDQGAMSVAAFLEKCKGLADAKGVEL